MTLKKAACVGIIGCGWLGRALAAQLKEQGVKVLATRTNSDNVKQLITQGIDAKVLLLPDKQQQVSGHQVFNSQCLVIAITPQFRQGRLDYGDKVEQVILAAKASAKVEKIILLSSSAVYNGLTGQVNEQSSLDLSADKVSVLSQAEQATLNYAKLNSETKKCNSYVLRLAGLVGPNRHPGNFLLKGSLLKSPNAKVNLIHQQDAVGIILSLLTTQVTSGIFNGVSRTHVTKKEYYQAAATALAIAPPSFKDDKQAQAMRIVSGDKVAIELGYQFVYPDLLAWLAKAGQ